MKLKDYMKKIEGIYLETAPEIIKLAKKDAQAQQDIHDAQNSRELTHEGKQKRIASLEAYRKEIRAEMDKLAAAADEQALAIRKTVETNFYSKFHATPDSMDMQAIELMKSGILTDSELRTLAGKFAGNNTMQRICGKYMEKSQDKDTQTMGRALQFSQNDPHLRAVDDIIGAGRACLGKGTQSGLAAAETFTNRFHEITANTYATAPDVEG